MTHGIALKTSLAVAMSIAACVCSAQQASDANAQGMSPAPATGVNGTVDTQQGVYAPAPAYAYPDARANMRAACAGLADRQTERACKDSSNDGMNASLKGNDAGNIEDQAD